jgi:hypothetical protein
MSLQKFLGHPKMKFVYWIALNCQKLMASFQDDPMVEYEDEFGRLRTARRSEVPRNLAPGPEEDGPDEDE